MRICLIGFGRIAERHVSAIRELKDLCEIAAVVEPDAERRRSAEQTLGVPAFRDLEDLIAADLPLELATILTPSGLHGSVAINALQLGIPVIVEKPFTIGAREGMDVIRSFNKSGVPIFVVKQNRLNEPVAEAFKMLRSGLLGDLQFVSASVLWSRGRDYYLQDAWRLSRQLDGGVVWNQASHYVDLVVQALGPISKVFAYGANFQSPAEAEDTVFALFKSESGAIGTLAATTTIRPRNLEGTLTISGSKRTVKIGGHALNRLESTAPDATSETGAGQVDYNHVYGSSHSLVYREILEDLMGGNSSQFRAERGIHVLEVMDAIHESIAIGAEVHI